MRGARSLYFSAQKKTLQADGYGGHNTTWTTEFHIVGTMKALQGYEQIRGLSLQDKITHRIETWYDARLTTAHRLLLDSSRVFNIRFIENVDERNIKMRLTVEEESNA